MKKLLIVIASIAVSILLTSCDIHFGVNGWTPPSVPHNPMPAPTSILDAAKYGDIEATKQFLGDGYNVNAKNEQNRTPLHIAAWLGHREIVSLLITKGAIIDARDNDNYTPLHKAAYEHKEILKLLIDNGADIKAKSRNGYTPLHNASLRGHNDNVELLIANGANLNAKTDDGATPLDCAECETADLLRKHGGKTSEELKAEGN